MISFEIENTLITQEELNEFEVEIGLSLPQDYKAHMLKWNGGSPLSYYMYFGGSDGGINLSYFFPIKYGDSIQVKKSDYLPEKYISIGKTDTGYLAMSLDEANCGSIFVHYSEVELEFVASSFTAFLKGLEDYTDVFE